MNDFRSKILSGDLGTARGLLGVKKPRLSVPAGESLNRLAIPRTETRTANHRDQTRHRLPAEQPVTASYRNEIHAVSLVNMSGGGAMVESSFKPEMWDRVDLNLGSGGSAATLECVVRWIKGDRIGLEFAHETRIDADPETRSELLRAVLEQSFPASENGTTFVSTQASAEVPAEETIPVCEEVVLDDHSRRVEARHPLIWNGLVHWNHDTHPVRLRNISATGALIEGEVGFPAGAELLLDLNEAGQVFATVGWVHGDQAGLAFRSPFDLSRLASTKPQLATGKWTKPDYLRDDSPETSPWASEWGRLSVDELRRKLGR